MVAEQHTEDKKLIINAYKQLLYACRNDIEKEERVKIRKAFDMANKAHEGMRRKSGEPYITHPIEVAKIAVKEIGLGTTAVICALLHDTVEDTDLTLKDIEKAFDTETSSIIDGLTKISGVFNLKDSIQAENFRKLILTLADDVRVILIKIADRLHNMRTMDSMPEHKQLRISSETKFLYAPLAHRLGLYAIKSELEDLSLKYTDRKVYKDIAKKLAETKRSRENYIREFIKPVKSSLEEAGLGNFKIYGRPKSIHSIWNKMLTKKVSFEEVYDLFAIRIIIDCEEEEEKALCWKAYSHITDHYNPNPNRLRDWISTPKSNGYSSLHTTVMGPKGKWVEVQIRTKRMDEIAEKGFAAHFRYKEAKDDSQESAVDEWLAKIRENIINPELNTLDFVYDFKRNLEAKEIYVFTPKGDLRKMQIGSTALDFAFEIHTDIGSKCIGAKVNHKLVPLSHKLKTGDQIEVITSNKQKPSEDWLKFTVTSKARNKIKSMLKEEKRRVAMEGKELLHRKLKQMKVKPTPELYADLLTWFRLKEDLILHYNIATRKINVEEIKKIPVKHNRIIFKRKEPTEQSKNKIESGTFSTAKPVGGKNVLIFDESIGDELDYTFATCCSAIPGDSVFGFITIGQGIKIHRTNCPNAPDLIANYGYRILKARWSNSQKIAFLTGIHITGIDDIGVIQKITNVISVSMKINIRSLTIDAKEDIFHGTVMVYCDDNDQLNKLIEKLKTVDGIISAQRFEKLKDD